MINFNEKYSLVRVLHALVSGEELDVYIDGFPFYMDVRFAQFTPYIYVPEGNHIFSVYLKDEREKPLAEVNIDVKNDELITAAIIERNNKVDILPIPEERGVPEDNTSKIKFVHLVPELPNINVLIGGEEVFNNVGYTDYTEYKNVPIGEYKMDIELTENKKTVLSNLVNINPNRIYTFYAIGISPNVDMIQTLDGATFLQ